MYICMHIYTKDIFIIIHLCQQNILQCTQYMQYKITTSPKTQKIQNRVNKFPSPLLLLGQTSQLLCILELIKHYSDIKKGNITKLFRPNLLDSQTLCETGTCKILHMVVPKPQPTFAYYICQTGSTWSCPRCGQLQN